MGANENIIKQYSYNGFRGLSDNPKNYHDSLLEHFNVFDKRYDEPTYITFRIDFFPMDIESPNYDYMPCPLLNKEPDTENYKYSTLDYLRNNLGDNYRADLLERFIDGLLDICVRYPYYIKSITGLNEIMSIDPKRGTRVAQDKVITIKCNEGLDLKISSLLTLYKKIAWDDIYQRWILPDIMRFFKMNIYVSEFRTFHSHVGPDSDKMSFKENPLATPSKTKSLLSGLSITNTVKKIANQIGSIIGSPRTILDNKWALTYSALNDKIPTLKFECNMCEFDISDIFSKLNEIVTTNPGENKLDDIEIKIKIGNIKESHSFPLMMGNPIVADKLQINTVLDHTYLDRTGIPVGTDENVAEFKLMNNISNLPIETSFAASATYSGGGDGLLSTALKKTVDKAVAWADNHINDKVNQVMNKTWGSGISIKGALDAITSADLFTMYSTFKTKADAMKSLYPEVSQATNKGLDVEIFEGILKGIANSEATTDNEKAFNNIAKELLTVDAKSVDDYLNTLKDAIQIAEMSRATNETRMNHKVLL